MSRKINQQSVQVKLDKEEIATEMAKQFCKQRITTHTTEFQVTQLILKGMNAVRTFKL